MVVSDGSDKRLAEGRVQSPTRGGEEASGLREVWGWGTSAALCPLPTGGWDPPGGTWMCGRSTEPTLPSAPAFPGVRNTSRLISRQVGVLGFLSPLSVSQNRTTLGTSRKWNHAIVDLLYPVVATKALAGWTDWQPGSQAPPGGLCGGALCTSCPGVSHGGCLSGSSFHIKNGGVVPSPWVPCSCACCPSGNGISFQKLLSLNFSCSRGPPRVCGRLLVPNRALGI